MLNENSKIYVAVVQDTAMNERACEIVADSRQSAVYEAERWCRACDYESGGDWEVSEFYAEGIDDNAIAQIKDRVFEAGEQFDTIYA